MKVLHISQADAGGGSARSAYRIHTALRERGVGSRMVVGQRHGDDADVRLLKRHVGWRIADRACSALFDRLDLQYVCYPSSFGVALDPWFRAADVVQLYNTHGSYFSHSALPLLSRLRPIAWRLSDMWALTGHVAYSFDCERWLDGCGSCPYLDVYPALRRDRTALLWRWKQTVYRRSRLHLIAPSRWLEGLARRSPLLSRFPIHLVPNGIDTGTFRPGARPELKRELGLDPERPVVLFSALDVSDPRKGGAELRDALGRLDELDFQLVVMGGQALDLPRPVVSLGRLDEDEAIARAFAAADVYVLPTLAENLPNVALEALACGTPTVAFAAGGVGDAVRHLETGYLAAVGDVDGLAAGIRTLLADAELRGRLGASARAVAEAEYGVDREARDLLAIYEEMRAA